MLSAALHLLKPLTPAALAPACLGPLGLGLAATLATPTPPPVTPEQATPITIPVAAPAPRTSSPKPFRYTPPAATSTQDNTLRSLPDPLCPRPATDNPTLRGVPLRRVGRMVMEVTAYSPHADSCAPYADGLTAAGFSVATNRGKLVAADPTLLPIGSLVSVPGYDDGRVVPVLDTGGAIQGRRLDLLFPTREQALAWGRRQVVVTLWECAADPPALTEIHQ